MPASTLSQIHDSLIGKVYCDVRITAVHHLRDAFPRSRIYNQISEIIAGA